MIEFSPESTDPNKVATPADKLFDALIEGDFEEAGKQKVLTRDTADELWGERVYALREQLSWFVALVRVKFPGAEEQEVIFDALKFTISLHVDQKGRVDGSSALSHVFSVGFEVLRHYRAATLDDVIAALLHDSIEDRPTLLAKMGVEKLDDNASEDYLRGQARSFIRDRFGEKVGTYVFHLTSPLPYPDTTSGGADQLSQEEKLQHYFGHVNALVETDIPGLIAIKWADAMQNMPLGPLRLRAKVLRRQGDEGVAQNAEEKSVQLYKKYRKTLKEVWLPFWQDKVREGSPLYPQRAHALAFIGKLLEGDYADA